MGILFYGKVLALFWLINLAPVLLAHLLGTRWQNPLDEGRTWGDDRALFGPHKTKRGILAALLTGAVVGLLLGFPWWMGFGCAMLSMAGDLLSSFIKRRRALPSGSLVPGLDQLFEGLFPFFLLAPFYGLGIVNVFILTVVFVVGAYWGSWFLKEVLLSKPYEDYPRPVNSWVRLREIKSCQITSNPFHHFVNFEDSFYYHIFMKNVFKILGIYEKGKKNALNIKKTELDLHFPDLPPAFDNYCILYLSDLHLDGLDGLTERIMDMVREEPVDLCVLGGDFRMATHGPFGLALDRLDRVMSVIRAGDGCIGVLGNHDCLEIVEPLKERGIHFLINDSRAITRNGETIWFVGVDDPHYYKCHNLNDAFDGVPRGAFTIFLAHSNEIYKEVAPYAPSFYLCGHTHAGQIQFPHVGPVFTHSSAPRRYCQGLWQYGNMRGYTSNGVGVSGVPVRFLCQGEVLLLTLKRGAG